MFHFHISSCYLPGNGLPLASLRGRRKQPVGGHVSVSDTPSAVLSHSPPGATPPTGGLLAPHLHRPAPPDPQRHSAKQVLACGEVGHFHSAPNFTSPGSYPAPGNRTGVLGTGSHRTPQQSPQGLPRSGRRARILVTLCGLLCSTWQGPNTAGVGYRALPCKGTATHLNDQSGRCHWMPESESWLCCFLAL